jgi:hypothetical protein
MISPFFTTATERPTAAYFLIVSCIFVSTIAVWPKLRVKTEIKENARRYFKGVVLVIIFSCLAVFISRQQQPSF